MNQKVTINLVRHGQTAGNQKKRYIGITDESLCWQGVEQLLDRNYPKAEVWFYSPMKRCVETAELMGMRLEDEQIAVRNFRECDFGLFENKNYEELADCPEYQEWVDSNAALPFPDGDDVEDFKARCTRAFAEMLNRIFREQWTMVNVVVHGGTIMSIMEKFAPEKKDYYQWHVENGCGYVLEVEETAWKEEKKISSYEKLEFED